MAHSKSRRVAYVVSDELIKYADLLPSNKGRSSLVHSLAYHLDLLDLSSLEAEEDKGVGIPSAARLLGAVGADVSGDTSIGAERRRATVYRPRAATHQQLTSYHEESFLKQLAKGANAGEREEAQADSNKRRRPNSGSKDDASESDSESSGVSSHDPDDSLELPRRPSSYATGPFSQRGHKRSRPSKNQFGLQDDCPAFPGLSQHVSLIAGAAMTAADLLATGQTDVAIAWDGGRHHAKKDSASGFCYINDVVLAILSLRKPRKVTVTTQAPSGESVKKTTVKRTDRVLYLDLDLHWGDGVEEAFHSSPSVLTLSIHHYAPGFFPCYTASSEPSRYTPPGSLKSDTGKASTTLNLPLGIGASDTSLERVLESIVEPLVEAWDPEMVVVQCGVDGLAGDPMAVWNLSAAAYVRAIERVLGWRKPTLLLGGGGYNSENAARCWSLITALCLGRFEEGHHGKRRVGVAATSDQPQPLTQQIDSSQDKAQEKDETSLDYISYDTQIPDHKFWPNYAPTYTLDVPAGEMIDQNDESHFEVVNKTFLEHIKRVSSR